MDRYMNIMFKKEYDVDGSFAHLGKIDEYKLEFIMKDKFYKKNGRNLLIESILVIN